MFSSVKSFVFRGRFFKNCLFCAKCNPDILGCLRSLKYNNGEVKYIQKRFVSHRPGTLVNSDASDSDRENPNDYDEAGTRKRPIQIRLIYEALKKNKFLAEEELIQLRENVLSAGTIVSKSNIDALIIGMCSSLRNMEFAEGYLNFLKQRNLGINVATLGKYLKLCHACGEIDDETKVLNIWHSLKEKLPVMDSSTAENVIHGLSITSEWKQGLDLLKIVKETSTPSVSAYSALVAAAFRNKDLELGWNLLEECVKEGKTPLESIYQVWLDEYCTLKKQANVGQCVEMAEKLLNFFSCHELLVSKDVTQKLKIIFEKVNWHGRYTVINERGACMACKVEMRPIFITKSEFQVLSQTFLEKVLVGPDIFSKSSPEEVEAFQELIAKKAPFNTVIDGLNVAYSSGGDTRHSRSSPAAILRNVVAHFVDLSHKILVLGRTHMNTWPRKEMEYIRKNSELFLAENISQDDPFLLYAAMSSGPGTCFLSRDLMRGHAYRLKCAEPNLASVFRRWQMSHQMRLIGVSQSNRVQIKLPMEFSPMVQKVDGRWHIPCQEVEDVGDNVSAVGKQPAIIRSHLDSPTTWLCLSPKKYGEKSQKRNFYGDWNDKQHIY